MIEESTPLGKRNHTEELEAQDTVEAEPSVQGVGSRERMHNSAPQDEGEGEDVGPMPMPEIGASGAPRKKRKGGYSPF